MDEEGGGRVSARIRQSKKKNIKPSMGGGTRGKIERRCK